MDLLKLTALELGEKIKAKEVTVREAVDAVIGQIKETESEIHSFVTIDEEGAYAQAEEIQKKIDAGELTGSLAGVPVAVKDNMCIEGQLTTCSSKILSNFKPTYTAEAVENLRKAGAVIIGKTNILQVRQYPFCLKSDMPFEYAVPRVLLHRQVPEYQ